MHSDRLPYRLGVGIMLLNPAKQVFVGKRIDTLTEAWQMPQGGIDEGEEPVAAAVRELEEETSVTNAVLLSQSKDWYYYDLPEHVIPNIWGGKYRGQKQRWYVFEHQGSDDDVNIQTHHPEFCEWQWANPMDLPKLIVPFKQELYQNLLVEFREWV
mgnify:CR=1 FL=1|tara:strand:+ start:569 stop:1036 length:468 start_codon:yes stop_codon:yes gene_type:complete